MSLNSSSGIEDIEIGKISEKASENHEQTKKAQSQLKKIQKDEKFAQEDNQKLFLILSRFIQDSYYEKLIPEISLLLGLPLPSRIIIAFIALFYPDASYFVLDTVNRKEKMELLLSLPQLEGKQYFDEKNIHPDLQKWLTEWITSMELFLTHNSSSFLMQRKFLNFSDIERKVTQKSLAEFLKFFFFTRNVIISDEKAGEYAFFIMKNITRALQKYLSIQEEYVNSLLEDVTLSSKDFFG